MKDAQRKFQLIVRGLLEESAAEARKAEQGAVIRRFNDDSDDANPLGLRPVQESAVQGFSIELPDPGFGGLGEEVAFAIVLN